jgi:hypothetical protein
MSSTGPGSLLVFLAFLMLSMLLVGTYFVAYLGLVQAGREVQKAGEAASEQAIVYLFQRPTNITVTNGSVTVKGETRIVIQNVGSREISFDRILAISPDGSVVADVKVPGNKGLGVRQWQLYKVQDLGLPDRWNNFTVFSSEVSRLVLLSERGRTHGSIWGVPPFLEGIFRTTLATTMTTSYFYSFITTTSYQTTHTVTIKLKQDMYSLTEEWWESGRKVELDNVARRNKGCSYVSHPCCGSMYYCEHLRGAPTHLAYPNIKYFPYNASVSLSYPSTYTHEIRKKWCDWVQIDPYTYACMEFYEEYYEHYKLQAIELVDWDTGKVYLSINQTSVTFNIDRDTRAKAMYVLESSWSRSWSVIVYISGPTPENCMKILNDPSKVCTREWCECARIFDPDAAKNQACCQPEACLKVNVGYCCLGPDQENCVSSWSGSGGKQCVKLKEGESATVTVGWSASWTTKPGWSYYDTTFNGPGQCYGKSSGHCEATLNAYQDVTVWVTVIFKKT